MQKLMSISSKLVLVCLLLGVFSCQQSGKQSAIDSVDSAENLNRTQFAKPGDQRDNSQLLLETFSHNLYALKSSQKALQQTSNERVRKLAITEINNHAALNKAITGLASAKQINLPADLSREQLSKLNALSQTRGPDFDDNYVRQMVNGRKETLVVLEEAKESADPDIIRWADELRPKIEQQLGLATSCQNALDSMPRKPQ
jgi:predicted outer membrane protein